MIFVNQRTDVDNLASYLKNLNYSVSVLHGSKTQDQREKALSQLREGLTDILVCTNVAARGIDIEGVAHVINFHAPANIVDYIHRIGRTGRAGRKGMATTFLTAADEALFYDLKKFLSENDQHVPNELTNHPASKIRGGTTGTVPTSTQKF